MGLGFVVLGACSGAPDDGEPTGAPTEAGWSTVAEELPGALLSVTGTSATDVWAVGAEGDAGPGVLHFDGVGWSQVPTDTTGDLWWVWLPPDARDAPWAVGAGGRVLRFDGAAWSETVLDPVLTLFGVWGSSSDDVWTVGGDLDTSSGAGMWHWDGRAWTEVALPPAAASALAVYKVWGAAADDVWACGANGLLLHWDGAAWATADGGGDRTLLTVSGAGPDAVWAVGGIGGAEIRHWDGAAWSDESPAFAPELNGVSARDDRAVAAGRTGAVWTREADGTWVEDPRGRAGFLDLHATWLDPDGGVWLVGGAIATRPMLHGTLLYGGPARVPAYRP